MTSREFSWRARFELRLIGRKALVAVACAPVLTVVFIGLVTAAMMLPNDGIATHVLERSSVLTDRRADNGRVIDADTECIGLSVGLYGPMTAGDNANPRDRSAFYHAVQAKSLYGCTPFLLWLRDDAAPPTVRDYFRYWHGHMVVSRPLLSILPYNDVRGVLFTLSIGLLGVLLWRLGRDLDPLTAIAFGLPFLILNAHGYWVVATKAVSWFLIIGASIAATRLGRREAPLIMFFIVGALTAFFDFLTAPALVFAYPAFIWFVYDARRRKSQGDDARRVGPVQDFVLMGGFWVAGFAGLWLMKLLVASAILDVNVWADALGSVQMRLRGADDQVDSLRPGAAIWANLMALKSIWLVIAIGLFGVAPFLRRRGRLALRRVIVNAPVFVLLAGAPIIWMELLSNHSQIHAAFTHLNFATLFGFLGLLLFQREDRILPPEYDTTTPVRADDTTHGKPRGP